MTILHDEWTPLFESLRAKVAEPFQLLVQIGGEVKECTLENFGQTGTNRPLTWKELSPRYMKWLKKHGYPERSYATLYLTGDLFNSIDTEFPVGNSVSVTAYDEKASVHQEGQGKPWRPFFPITASGELTDYCRNRLMIVMDNYFSRT